MWRKRPCKLSREDWTNPVIKYQLGMQQWAKTYLTKALGRAEKVPEPAKEAKR